MTFAEKVYLHSMARKEAAELVAKQASDVVVGRIAQVIEHNRAMAKKEASDMNTNLAVGTGSALAGAGAMYGGSKGLEALVKDLKKWNLSKIPKDWDIVIGDNVIKNTGDPKLLLKSCLEQYKDLKSQAKLRAANNPELMKTLRKLNVALKKNRAGAVAGAGALAGLAGLGLTRG